MIFKLQYLLVAVVECLASGADSEVGGGFAALETRGLDLGGDLAEEVVQAIGFGGPGRHLGGIRIEFRARPSD